MSVARFPGEGIAGEKITYEFGKVVPSNVGGRCILACNFNGDAYVVQRWLPRAPADLSPVPDQFDALVARAVHGEADKCKDDGKVHRGSHRAHTGVLKGHASMIVRAPRDNVAHLTKP